MCLAQIESEIALERSRQKGREHHNQVVDDKVMSYKFTSASHAVDVLPGKDWITMIYKAFDPSKTKIIKFGGNAMNYWSFIQNFKNCLDGVVSRSGLNYLIQFCDGEHKATIVHCSNQKQAIVKRNVYYILGTTQTNVKSLEVRMLMKE